MDRNYLEDEALIEATAAGDAEAFGAFYRRHEDAILVFFLQRTGSAEVAADLTAEVFAAALAGCGRFKRRAQPAVAWLYGIARKKLALSRRQNRTEDRARQRLAMERLEFRDEELERVEQLLDARESVDTLDRLLRELPPQQYEAVRSRIVDERSYREIAGQLHCTASVVRQRVSRGIRTLRAQLSQEAK